MFISLLGVESTMPSYWNISSRLFIALSAVHKRLWRYCHSSYWFDIHPRRQNGRIEIFEILPNYGVWIECVCREFGDGLNIWKTEVKRLNSKPSLGRWITNSVLGGGDGGGRISYELKSVILRIGYFHSTLHSGYGPIEHLFIQLWIRYL